MPTHADKSPGNKSRSVAASISRKRNNETATFQLEDERPEARAQRQLQENVQRSDRAAQMKPLLYADRAHTAQPKQAPGQAASSDFANLIAGAMDLKVEQGNHLGGLSFDRNPAPAAKQFKLTPAQRSPQPLLGPTVIQAVAPGGIAHIQNSCFVAAIINTFASVKSLKNLLVPQANNLVGVSRRLPQLQDLLLRVANSVSVGQMVPAHWVQAIMYSLRKNGIIADFGPQDVNEVLNLLVQRLTATNGVSAGQYQNRPVSSGIIPWDRRTGFVWTILSSVDRYDLPNVIHLERMAGNNQQAWRTFFVPIPHELGGGREYYRLRSMVNRDTTTFDEAHFVSNVDVGGPNNQEWHQSDDIGPRVSPIDDIEEARAPTLGVFERMGIRGPSLMSSSVSYIYERYQARAVSQGDDPSRINSQGGPNVGRIAMRFLERFQKDHPQLLPEKESPSKKKKESEMNLEEGYYSDLSDEEEGDMDKINAFFLEKIKKLPMLELSKKVYDEDSSESEDDTPDPKDKVKTERIKLLRQKKAGELEAIVRSSFDLTKDERGRLQNIMKLRKADYNSRKKKRRKYSKGTQKMFREESVLLKSSSFYHNRFLRRASKKAISKTLMEKGGSKNYSSRQGVVRKELLEILKKDNEKMKWKREDFSSDDVWQVVQFLMRNKLSGQNAKKAGYKSMKEALASKDDMTKPQPKVTPFTEFHHLGFKESLGGNLEGLALNLLNLVAVNGRRRESSDPEGDYGYHQFLHDITAFDTGIKEFEERAGKTKDERGKIGGVFRDIDLEALYYLLKHLIHERKSKKELD